MKSGRLRGFVIRHPVLGALFAIVALLVAGSLGFWATGGDDWSLFDALYMAVITVTTVGFSEVHPLNPAGRVITILLVLGGAGTVVYLLSSITEALLRGRGFWRKRQLRAISRMSGHMVVCGDGRVGNAIAGEIERQGRQVVTISLEEPPVESERHWIQGDATDDDVLRSAGIERAAGLVTALGSDADNIYTVLAARTLCPGLFIVARCGADRSARKLLAAGADRVINPYERGGVAIAQVLLRPKVVDFLETISTGGQEEIQLEQVEIGEGSQLVGVELRESPIRRDLDIIVTAILRRSGGRIFNPAPGECIGAGDVLIAMGRPSALDRLAAIASGEPKGRQQQLRPQSR